MAALRWQIEPPVGCMLECTQRASGPKLNGVSA